MFCDNPDCKFHAKARGVSIYYATNNGLNMQTKRIETHLWRARSGDLFLCDNCNEIIKMFQWGYERNLTVKFKAETWLGKFINTNVVGKMHYSL